MELKYVYLIGIGSVLFYLACLACSFQNFPNEFKTESGTVHLYFEATTVILTLLRSVVRGQSAQQNHAIKDY
jgi:hypothetical protein